MEKTCKVVKDCYKSESSEDYLLLGIDNTVFGVVLDEIVPLGTRLTFNAGSMYTSIAHEVYEEERGFTHYCELLSSNYDYINSNLLKEGTILHYKEAENENVKPPFVVRQKSSVTYSKTEPKVSMGDIVILEDGTELFVTEIKDGIPYGRTINNNELPSGPFAMFAAGKIEGNYKKVLLSDNWKLPDGTPFNQYIAGIDPISNDSSSASITHTRNMSVEDIIKEYGDTVSEEALETLKGIKVDYEKRADEILLQSDIDYDKMFVNGLLFGASSHHFDVKEDFNRPVRHASDFLFIPRRSKIISYSSKAVAQPWGSYIPTIDGFFIPPDRKPYEPDCVAFSGHISDFTEIENAQNQYNILMNEISNKITVEKLELIVEYLTKVVSKHLSSKKKARVFRKIRKIYG